MNDWYFKAIPIEEVDVEICFLLQDDFDGQPLKLPPFPRKVSKLVRTTELVGNEDALASYYRQILNLAQKAQRPFNEVSHYFWLRLYFWNNGAGFTISFPWYDTYSEMQPILNAIISGKSGELYWDRDQCWEMNVEADGGRIYVRQWDPDCEEVHVLLNFPLQALQALIPTLMNRTEEQIACMSRLFGRDYWTKGSWSIPTPLDHKEYKWK